MFAENDRSWIEKSVPVIRGQVEVIFLLKNEFYVGDDENYLKDQQNTVPLQPPVINNHEKLQINSTAVLNYEPELAAYYKCVLNHAHTYGKSLESIRHYFWLRLQLFGKGGVELRFPWYDTWNEMDAFLRWLLSASEGEYWGDIEQGWEIAVVRAGSYFHIREGNGDGVELANAAFQRVELLSSAAELRKRIPTLITKLSREVGNDYWTARPD